MARGRKAKPIPANAPTPAVKPPSWLRKEAKAEFKRIVAILVKQKISSELDIAALTVYATSMADYRDAQKKVDELGLVVDDGMGKAMRSPYLAILKETAARIQPLYAEFGLTPSARAKLKLEHDPDAADDEDEFGL